VSQGGSSYLVDQRTERRCSGLKVFENIAFVFKAEMTDAFDHDGLFTLVAVN
jgi:hypothetical protein